jgi:shikimate dehydrogenase
MTTPLRPYAEVIGDPIVQSKSPAIHGCWLAELGIDAAYHAGHITSDGLAAYLTARRNDPAWRGCNVTMPHKQAVMPYLDHIDPLAVRVGAVNTIVRGAHGALSGFNTDVLGFLEPLCEQKFATVTVVGAGGAARAILAALGALGVRYLTLQNRSVAKAQALLDEFALPGMAVELGADCPPADLLVNTSSLGMQGHPPLPPLLDHVAHGGTVYDIVTTPLETALIHGARQRGLAVIDGLAMLIGQADHAFTHFFGQHPPRQHDAVLRDRITA